MRTAVVLFLLLAAVASGLLALARQQESFPHSRHEGLFPTCTGCHAGVVEDDSARLYPAPDACTGCHDGDRRPAVEVGTPEPDATTLRFSHALHARVTTELSGEATDCARCHGLPGAQGRMAVVPATAESCLDCHPAEDHLAEGRDCSKCHAPLTGTPALTADRIATFPEPPSHGEAAFLLDHDPGADIGTCATCHARESCARCHLNGDEIAPIRALDPDPRVAELVEGLAPEYPEPTSHDREAWGLDHGAAARADAGGCASCHVRSSCESCHVGVVLPAAARLPVVPEGDPRGVRLADERGGVHWPGYATGHGPAAASGAGCESCHDQSFCESCHASAERPAFHLPNFLERHGPEAYSAQTDCSSCHSTEVFCRSCHAELGMGDRRSPGLTIHTARPFWLLGHGTAARQGLSGCVTCHSQADCATCHSAAFGWRVNPHGPSFDAERSRDANPFSCARCHRGGVEP